jgi:hypothetical protein
MFRKIDHLTIYSLLLTIASILLVFFFQVRKSSLIEEERKLMAYKAEAKEIGLTLAMASDYLTSEVRKFTVTLNPVHLRNYWREVKVTSRRDEVLKRLEKMKGPKAELDLLEQAKNNSDALINTETLAQRLILEVYGVPEAQMEPEIRDYHLTQEDRELSLNEKVNKAREILHTKQYDDDKEHIRAPIRKFQQTIEARIDTEIEDARDRTDRMQFLSGLWMVVLTLLIFIFAFNVIQRIGTPLKDLEAQLKNNDGKIELSGNAVAAITNIGEMVNHIREKKVSADSPVDDKTK